MMVSFIICFLPALLATTSAQGILTCEKCYGTTRNCRAPSENCTVTKGIGGCRSAAGESTLGNGKTSVLYKECIGDYNTGIKGSISFTVGDGSYLRINATRCNDTDKCNTALLEVPKENTTLNGRQCPACFTLNADFCQSENTNCTGDENYCINFAGKILQGSSLSSFAAQGCGTASTQDIKPGTYLVSGTNIYLFEKATSTPPDEITTTPRTTTPGTTIKISDTTTPADTTIPTPTTTTLGTTTTTPTSPITITTNTTENTTTITEPFITITATTNTTTINIILRIPTATIITTLTNTTTTTTITTPGNTYIVTVYTTAISITTTTTTPPSTNTNNLPPSSIAIIETLPKPTATALKTT